MKQSKGMLMKLVMQEKDHQQFCTNSSESKHIFALKIGKYHLKKKKPQKKNYHKLNFLEKNIFLLNRVEIHVISVRKFLGN